MGGVKGLIRDGENGYFFDPASENAVATLADRLTQLAANPGLRSQMAAAGLKDVKANYTWQKVCAQLESVYQAAAARH